MLRRVRPYGAATITGAKRITAMRSSILAATAALAVAGCVAAPPAPPAPPPPAAASMPAEPQVAPLAPGANGPSVGGAEMLPTRPILDNIAAASTLTTLNTAIRSAGFAPYMSGTTPVTVFAPTNDAFGRLAPGTVADLLKPENKPTLLSVLGYHVVPGTITLDELRRRMAASGGQTSLTTVLGQPLTLRMRGSALAVTDASGNTAYVELADVRASNGLLHITNGVLIPKL